MLDASGEEGVDRLGFGGSANGLECPVFSGAFPINGSDGGGGDGGGAGVFGAAGDPSAKVGDDGIGELSVGGHFESGIGVGDGF